MGKGKDDNLHARVRDNIVDLVDSVIELFCSKKVKVNKEIQEFKSGITNVSKEVESVRDSVDSLKKEVNKVQDAVSPYGNTLNTIVELIDVKLTEKDRDIAKYSDVAAAAIKAKELAEGQRVESEDKLRVLQEDFNKLQRCNEDLNSKLINTLEELEITNDKIKELNSEIREKDSEIRKTKEPFRTFFQAYENVFDAFINAEGLEGLRKSMSIVDHGMEAKLNFISLVGWDVTSLPRACVVEWREKDKALTDNDKKLIESINDFIVEKFGIKKEDLQDHKEGIFFPSQYDKKYCDTNEQLTKYSVIKAFSAPCYVRGNVVDKKAHIVDWTE